MSLSCQAQRTEYIPPQTGRNDVCVARAYNPAQIDSCVFIHTIINKGNPRPFAWNNLLVLDNNADDGESTGQYIKANQFGKGATWASVLQVQCVSPTGFGCFAQEIDIQPPHSGEVRGYGIMAFVFRENVFGPPAPNAPAHALAGFSISPGYGEENADIVVAYDSQIHCTVACFRMLGGESMAYDGSGIIVQKFDPQTGYAGWWRADLGLCVWCVNMTNGDIRRMWKP